MSALWPRGIQGASMESFIQDDRLIVWFVQNYDAIGCNVYTCSSFNNETHWKLIQKLRPIPIGLDLHTFGSVSASLSRDQTHYSMNDYEQFRSLQIMKSFIQTYDMRIQWTIVTAFECSFDQTKIGQARQRSRGSVCALLRSSKFQSQPDSKNVKEESNIKLIEGFKVSESKGESIRIMERRIVVSLDSFKRLVSTKMIKSPLFDDIVNALSNDKFDKWDEKETRRLRFWMTLAFSKFSLAPPGFGMDTHRLWETLVFGCIPIVQTSPLDILYSQFPIVIVKTWDEVAIPGALDRFEADIKNRFGPSPFNEDIQRKLSLEYWKNAVQKFKAEAKAVNN